MSPENERQIEFNRLNVFGKGIFVAGTVFRTAIGMIDSTVETLSGIFAEAEKAFSEGRDPNVDEAKILDEHRGHDPK